MLKSNKEMAKQAFGARPGAPPMDDAQLEMMLNMMTPEMMRMSLSFARQNPEMARQQAAGSGAAPQAYV
jgi:hypothetical protein